MMHIPSAVYLSLKDMVYRHMDGIVTLPHIILFITMVHMGSCELYLTTLPYLTLH